MVTELPESVLSLSDEELIEFLEERGMHPEFLNKEQRVRLAQDWLHMAKDPSIVPAAYLLFAASNAHGKVPVSAAKEASQATL